MNLKELRALEKFLAISEDADEDDIDHELHCVVRMLRADSSNAYLCGQPEKAAMLDDIVSRLERHEHRD